MYICVYTPPQGRGWCTLLQFRNTPASQSKRAGKAEYSRVRRHAGIREEGQRAPVPCLRGLVVRV